MSIPIQNVVPSENRPIIPAQGAAMKISGELCTPRGKPGKAIQLLMAGASYNKSYWNLAPGYSYVDSAIDRGYATLAFDRLNTGGSDRMPSLALTLEADAEVAHQVIQGVKSGAVGQHAYGEKVAVVGHSMGSLIAKAEQAKYNDAQAVILTGMTHMPGPRFAWEIGTGLVVPAQAASPHLADQPVGDLSTVEGNAALGEQREDRRQAAFYAPHAAFTDEAIAAIDEKTKDILSAGEFAGIVPHIQGSQSLKLKAPVMQAVGSEDVVFHCLVGNCASTEKLAVTESGRFPQAKNYTPYVQQGAGHSINLQNNNQQFFTAAQKWLDEQLL